MPIDADTFVLFRDAVERFVRERLIPREREIAQLEAPPQDLLDEVRSLGLFGLCYPESYGGVGLVPGPAVESRVGHGPGHPAVGHLLSNHQGGAGQCPVRAGSAAPEEPLL